MSRLNDGIQQIGANVCMYIYIYKTGIFIYIFKYTDIQIYSCTRHIVEYIEITWMLRTDGVGQGGCCRHSSSTWKYARMYLWGKMEYIRIGTRKKTYFNKKFNRPNNRPTDCQANEKAVCEGRRGIKHDGRTGAVGEAKKKKNKNEST